MKIMTRLVKIVLLAGLAGCGGDQGTGEVLVPPTSTGLKADGVSVRPLSFVEAATGVFEHDHHYAFHHYAFCAPAGARITLDTRRGTEQRLHTTLFLHPPDDEAGTWSDKPLADSRRPDAHAVLDGILLPVTGRYLVIVGTPYGVRSGSYTLRLDCDNNACTLEPGACQPTGEQSCPVEVDCAWVEANGDEPVTDARIESLNAYAAASLRARQCEIDETLARRGVTQDDRPNIADLYGVRVGNQETCMNGGFLLADFDLESDGRYRDMKAQIDMAIEFLKQFHEDTDGVPTVLFRDVVICPRDFFGAKLDLVGPRLYLLPRFEQWDALATMDAKTLRADLWTPGMHLESWPHSDALRLAWRLLDPAGTLRNALRGGLAQKALDLFRELVDLKARINGEEIDFDSLRTSLSRLVQNEVNDGAEVDAADGLRARAHDALIRADAGQLGCILDAWSGYLADPERWTAAAEAATAVAWKESVRKAMDIHVQQDGWLNIGNTKIIHVDLDVFLSSGYRDLERYVEVLEVEDNIDWEQTGGGINIYLVDGVEVSVSVNADRALPTAGLAEALQHCVE